MVLIFINCINTVTFMMCLRSFKTYQKQCEVYFVRNQRLCSDIRLQVTCSFRFFSFYVVRLFCSTFLMYLLSENVAFRLIHFFFCDNKTFYSFICNFDCMPKINWRTQYSAVHVILHGMFYLKKVRILRVPGENIRIITFTGFYVV